MLSLPHLNIGGFPGGSEVKAPACNMGNPGSIPGSGRSPGATHSSILAWRIPWTEEPGGLQSTGLQSRTQLSYFTFTFHFHLNIMRIRSYNLILLYGGGFPSKRKFIQYLYNIIYCVFVTWSCLTLCDPTDPSVYRQEYWSGLPFPSPENLPNPGIKPGSPALLVGCLPSEPPGKPYTIIYYIG